MRGKSNLVAVLISLIFVYGFNGDCLAELYSGQLVDVKSSSGPYYWGDGINDLYQDWSVAQYNLSGWFYGSSYSWSNADVYVYSGLSDPTAITDASVFPYRDSSTQTFPLPWGGFSRASLAYEGDTVFFRGTNGYYGAWYIQEIYTDPFDPSPVSSYLDGTWYFLDNGSSDFSIPEPATLFLLGLGAVMVRRRC